MPEDQYAEFTLRWMAAVWPKLKDDGSVLIVIDPHVKKGVMADYVLRMQLALRDFGASRPDSTFWQDRLISGRFCCSRAASRFRTTPGEPEHG